MAIGRPMTRITGGRPHARRANGHNRAQALSCLKSFLPKEPNPGSGQPAQQPNSKSFTPNRMPCRRKLPNEPNPGNEQSTPRARIGPHPRLTHGCVCALLPRAELGKLLLPLRQLGQVVHLYVWIGRVALDEMLMVRLGGVEALERHNLSDDRMPEDMRAVELGDVGFGDALLVVVCIEDRRAVLRAPVRPLAVLLGRIMRHGKEDLEQLAVADLRRV